MLNLKITKEKENKLLDRRELEFEVPFEGPTPNNIELSKEISSLTKAKENLIKIKKIDQRYGAIKIKVSAYIYNNEESLKILEPKKEVKSGKKGEVKEAPKAN